MNSFKGLRLITFDVTNTLISVAREIGPEYAKVAALYGVRGADDEVKVAKLTVAFRSNFVRLNAELPNFGLQGSKDSPGNPVQWWSKLVERTFADAGFEGSESLKIKSTAAHLFKLYSRGSAWKVKDGAVEILTDLQKSERSLGILSNFDFRLETIMAELGLTHFFTYRFISTQIGLAKPDPKLLEHVFKVAGITRPNEEYLHIGDSLELDYLPVVRAGGNAILIRPGGKESKDSSDIDPQHVVSELKDLRRLLL